MTSINCDATTSHLESDINGVNKRPMSAEDVGTDHLQMMIPSGTFLTDSGSIISAGKLDTDNLDVIKTPPDVNYNDVINTASELDSNDVIIKKMDVDINDVKTTTPGINSGAVITKTNEMNFNDVSRQTLEKNCNNGCCTNWSYNACTNDVAEKILQMIINDDIAPPSNTNYTNKMLTKTLPTHCNDAFTRFAEMKSNDIIIQTLNSISKPADVSRPEMDTSCDETKTGTSLSKSDDDVIRLKLETLGDDVIRTPILPSGNDDIFTMTNGHNSYLKNDRVTSTSVGESDSEKQSISKGPAWYKSQRYILSYILFGGLLNVFFQRVNFSIAIVCMVNHTATTAPTTTTTTSTTSTATSGIVIVYFPNQLQDVLLQHDNDTECEITSQSPPIGVEDSSSCLERDSDDDKKEDGPLRWDKQTQGMVLGALYWTYLALCIPGNAIIRRFSKKRTITIAVLTMSSMSMLIHVAALWSPWAVFVIKLVQGGCTALVVLAVYGMFGKWAPPAERTGLMSLTYAGTMCAMAVVFPTSGLLCKYGFLGGWPSVFYVFGVIGFLWTLIFIALTSETPALHPSITAEERKYIETSLSNTTFDVVPKTPWRHILTSVPVWGVILVNLGYSWGLFLLMSTLPQYMKEVLKFKIDTNGLYTMMPYLAMFVTTSTTGQIFNWIIQRRFIRLLWIRKIGAIIGNIVPAVLLGVLSYLDCTQSTSAIVLLSAAVGLSGINLTVILPNPYDLAPQFAQAITALSTTFATATGIITPYVVAAITKDKSKDQWQMVFLLTSGILVVGTLAYLIMASTDLQHWAVPSKQFEIKSDEDDDKVEDDDDSTTNDKSDVSADSCHTKF